jgi:hypothetical protein
MDIFDITYYKYNKHERRTIMEGQICLQDWMPEAYPGYKKPKNKRKKSEIKKENSIAPKIIESKKDGADFLNREYWYALFVAIMREDINSADDALSAMSIKRQYTQKNK